MYARRLITAWWMMPAAAAKIQRGLRAARLRAQRAKAKSQPEMPAARYST